LLSLGRAYSRKQDHFNALTSYSAAFSKEKTEFYQWLLLETGTSYMAVGDFSLAQSFTAGALRYEPDNLSFLGQMAYIQMLKGDFDGMFQTANRLVSIQNSAFGRTILARYYLIKGDFEKSIAVYRDCFSQANNNDYFWTDEKVSFAYALNKVGKVREAAELIQQANKALESNIDNREYVQAKVYALQGDNSRAVDALKKWKAIPGFHLWLVNDPLFSALKQNADFKEFVDKLHADAEVVKKQSDEKRAAGLFPTLDMIEKN
jgi:tetratricopeptide (TPR) repeat protein